MSFAAGMIVGGMLAGSHATPQDTQAQPPTMCIMATNFQEYRTCRWPEIMDQLQGGNGWHFCVHIERDAGKDDKNACDPEWRAGLEWRGILRARGITPK